MPEQVALTISHVTLNLMGTGVIVAISLLKHEHAEEIYKLLQQIPKGNSEHPQGEH
jgi:hypothetical protein